MTEEQAYSWYNSVPAKDEVGTVGKTPVDARIKGYQFSLCEFAGNHASSDGKRYCKHYIKSLNRSCCMYYNKDFRDYEKPPAFQEPKHRYSRCDFKEDKK